MKINPKLLKSIEEYCKFNHIEDIEKEINNILQTGFNIIRFGTSPFTSPPPIEEVTPLPHMENKVEFIENKKEDEIKEVKPKRVYKRKPKAEPMEVVTPPTDPLPIEEVKQPIQEIEEKPKKRVRVIKVKKEKSDD